VFKTVSWRVTQPLRSVRSIRRRGRRPDGESLTPSPAEDPRSQPGPLSPNPFTEMAPRLVSRLATVTSLLNPSYTGPSASVADSLEAFASAVDDSDLGAETLAWLGMVAIRGSYPDEVTLESASRRVRRGGGRGLAGMIEERFSELVRAGDVESSPISVSRDRVLIDVSHTATYDLHTGIQRVVREAVSRWLRDQRSMLVQWNLSTNSTKELAPSEADRFIDWRAYLHAGGSKIAARPLTERDGSTVIPWNCAFLMPELIDTTARCSGYRALARSGVVRKFSMIGYDLIPMTASETVTDGMTANFGQYLALVKHATHVSAISESAGSEFRAFGSMLAAQGLAGPEVFAHPLPGEAPTVTEDAIAAVRDEFGLGALPLVLVVGSHEPRKNHLTVLESAELLWRRGLRFELLFAGGSSWGRSDFGSYVESLVEAGYPIRVFERVSEGSLWSLYAAARCSVFTSLIEGYGLPIAESLSCGTPVVTADYGSMAELGSGGGALMVNPRDPQAVAEAIERLIADDVVWSQLAEEAERRLWPTWDDYAAQVWADLT
jgi:glycosyltransferase involved in cell wall biosynthesis